MEEWVEYAEQLKYEQGVSWSNLPKFIFEKFGMKLNKEAIRFKLRSRPAYKGKIEYEDKKPLPTPEDITEYYETLKAYNDALDNLDTKQTKATITINDDKPIGIAYWGDWHIGARGVDYDQFDEDKKLIIETDGLYCIGGGDYKDNQNALVHASGVNEQIATPGMQDMLVRNFFYELKNKMLAAVRGCHDDWDKRVGDKDFLGTICEVADCVNLWHGGGVTIKLGSQTYKNRVRHKYVGESGINTTNVQRRLLEAFGPADVIAVFHRHYPDYQKLDRMEQKVAFIRGGSYKVYDEHGQKIGGYRAKIGVPVVVFFPDEHRFIGADNLRDGIALLNSVR